jgi:hypothetical protein
MAVTELYVGAETGVTTTEWSMTTDTGGPDADTTKAIIQALVDVSDMIAGDVVKIRAYDKVKSGSTQRLAYEAVLDGAQAPPIFVLPTLMLGWGWDVTVVATTGTVNFEWSLRQAGTWTEAFNGQEVGLTGATVQSLTTDTAGPDAETSDGCFQAVIDVSDMVAGDLLRIRAYEKVQSAGTQRIVYERIIGGVQAQPLWFSPALLLLHGWDFTIEALSGTITLDWSIRKAA